MRRGGHQPRHRSLRESAMMPIGCRVGQTVEKSPRDGQDQRRLLITPPGLRRVHQFGDNSGMEDVVYDDVGEAVLPQCTQCEQCLYALNYI